MPKLDEIEWTQTCCGESGGYAEVQGESGVWFQMWNHSHTSQDKFMVRRYAPDKVIALDADRFEIGRKALQKQIDSPVPPASLVG